jgi:hypothetical protein
MAQFAQPTPDENLVAGWTVQGNTGSPGYAQAAALPVTTVVGQAGAGLPNPPGAGNIGSENSGSYASSILTNGSYAITPTTSVSQTATTPVPTTAGVQQPFGVNVMASVTGASVTSIAVAPFTTGTPSYTTVATFTASANAVSVSVPPGGFIKTGGANATAVVYTPTN